MPTHPDSPDPGSPRAWSGRATALVAGLVVAVLGGAIVADAQATPVDGRRSLVVDADAPDPAVVIADDTTYVFTTSAATERGVANVPTRRWHASQGWTTLPDALPDLPSWTRPGHVWAPGVARLASGRWLLAFTSRDVASGRQCIGLAVAAAPAGPYVSDAPRPAICEAAEGGSIDGAPFVEPDGKAWLLWKTDANARGRPTELRSVRIGADLAPLGPTHVLLRARPGWEGNLIENPALVATAHGLVLLYSGGRWEDAGYATGTARCPSPAGPCSRTSWQPALTSTDTLAGPGGASVAVDGAGTPQLVFHAWSGGVGYRDDSYRALHAVPVDLHTGTVRARPDRAPIGRRDDRSLFVLRTTPTPAPTDTGLRFGPTAGQPLTCDFDGNGVDAPTSFHAGDWTRAELPAREPASRFAFGGPGDRALCGDVDGDGRDDPILRRGGTFLVGDLVDGQAVLTRRIALGAAADIGIIGDWDGDGTADVGIYRDGPGHFVLRDGRGRQTIFGFGPTAGTPVTGDWDGDGRDEVGVFRDAVFHLARPLDPARIRHAVVLVPMGGAGDRPVSGRWSATAPTDSVGVVR